MRFIAAILFMTWVSSCNSNPSKIVVATIPAEQIIATKDQQERREKSERYCMSHHIPIYHNPNSMFVDPEDSVIIRTQDEVVDRALALFFIALKSEGLEQKYLREILTNYHITSKLTKKENEYVYANAPTEQQRIDANWRYESLHVLLWSLGFVDSLNYPEKTCDVANDVGIIHKLTEQAFRNKAKLRSKQEILDQADLILRIDWACEDARIKNIQPPSKLNKGVVMERHHSLNWLINYMQQEWDNVTTDT